MRALQGVGLALLLSTALFSQQRSGFVTPMPGHLNLGSTPVGPGIVRTTGSVVHPGGSSPQIAIPGIPLRNMNGVRPARNVFNNGNVVAYPVAVPVYMGGYDPSMYYGYAPAQQPPQQQQPNVVVVYPPPSPAYSYLPQQQPMMDFSQQQPAASQSLEPQPEGTGFLFAFKDHSIYSASAYWVDGDTLHYFTAGNTHNQVSISLVDRDLTRRLNEGTAHEVKLP